MDFRNEKPNLNMDQEFFYKRARKRLNMDITYRCPLECLRCGRQTSFRNEGKSVPGRDLTLEEFDKITNFFPAVSFCGQYSDSIHHPRFIEFLEMCRQKSTIVEVHVASSLKSEDFFVKAFQAYPAAEWFFGIDGLPNESHLYRVNQDGEKLYNIMLESKKYLAVKPVWQYIVFKYNQDHIEQALDAATQAGIDIMFINSSRWQGDADPLKPTVKYAHESIR